MNIKKNFLLKNVISAFTSILSLFTLSQPITLSYAVVLSATGVLVSAPLAKADTTQRKYIKSAANKYENGNLKEAIEDLNKAIAINPSNQIALTFRGMIRRELKDFEGAISDFTNVIGINPNNDDAYYYRGEAKIFNEGDLNKTVTTLNRQNTTTYKRRKDAIRDFDRAIEINSSEAKYYSERGFAKYLIEDGKGALRDFSKAIELDPKDGFLYRRRGFVKKSDGDFKGFCDDLKKALSLGDKNSKKWIESECRGKTSIQNLGDKDKRFVAVQYWQNGIKKEESGDDKGAIEDFNKSISIYPTKYAYNSRALTKAKLGDIKGAIDDYNKGISIDPEDPLMYRNRGVRKADLKDYKGAIEDFNKAIELTADDGYAYFQRGFAKGMSGDSEGACRDIQKASELGIENAGKLFSEICR